MVRSPQPKSDEGLEVDVARGVPQRPGAVSTGEGFCLSMARELQLAHRVGPEPDLVDPGSCVFCARQESYRELVPCDHVLDELTDRYFAVRGLGPIRLLERSHYISELHRGRLEQPLHVGHDHKCARGRAYVTRAHRHHQRARLSEAYPAEKWDTPSKSTPR